MQVKSNTVNCILMALLFSYAHADCKLINKQCLDNQATKIIGGVSFKLADACSVNGLSGVDCCWNLQKQILCSGATDTCEAYRQNSKCTLLANTCTDKDYITGNCTKFQSQYSCAGGYVDVESKVCTNVVCANNESGTAAKCYSPPPPSSDNTNQLGAVITMLQLGQNMAQEMTCTDLKDPSTCVIFSGKPFSCYMYMFKSGQPGSWNNNGADCLLNHQYFTKAGVATGYAASDRNIYSQATSGTNSVMGSITNYGLIGDDSKAINNSVKIQQQSNAPATNQDQKINYTPNNSKNSKIGVQNGRVVSVTINKDTISNLTGLLSFEAYLTDISVNLAWNRQKSEPNPENVKNITFADLGITRRPIGQPFGWKSGTNQPIINGLCVHLADSCDGGDDTSFNDLIKGQFAWAGGFTNPNFCAKCTVSLFGACITAEPKNVKQEWCCYNSKASMDINLAAYDQGLIQLYTGAGKYGQQVQRCGGVTVGMVSQIDFSKGNYFKDLADSIDVNKIVDMSSFTNNVQVNTQTRSNMDVTKMVNEYKKK